jgi:ATP-dependent Clp protease ATP-binding subunit ClpB
MNPELYTEKAWNSISNLPQYADRYGAQALESTHLFKAMLDDGPAGLAQRILSKAGVNVAQLDMQLDDHLSKQPKVSDTSNKVMGRTLGESLQKAATYKTQFGDGFISVEHLLLAVAETNGFTKTVIQNTGMTLEKLKTATSEIRGANKVTSRNPGR